MSLSLTQVTLEEVLPRRREALMSIIGNSFAAASPFSGILWIVDKTGEIIQFQTLGFLPGRGFTSRGELRLIEEGMKTRLQAYLDLKNLLVLSYLLHWIPAILLWFFQGIWGAWINPDRVALIQDWVLALLLIWPGIAFWFMKWRIRLRLKAYLHNLVFHT